MHAQLRSLLLSCSFVGAGMLVAGCETNPVTGRSQVMLVSEEQAQSASAQAYAKTVSQARSQRKLDTNSASAARVQRITSRLVAQAEKIIPASADWQWQVHVIEDSSVNAWCMPGGKMAVYTGLIQKINPTDDELAQVMAHEISHALLQHGRERMSRAVATNAALTLGSIATGVNLSGLENVAMVALELPNSRTGETEADRLGIEIAARAGYNPNAAISLWQKMAKLSGGSGAPEWLSTHPSDQTRIANLQQLVPKMTPLYQAARH
ncbi:MAG: M48 family metalloprotease [Betaproteobacteria bacterium]|nr:M48 family metalloprotease [Betaproteobacteria bacterium]